MSRGGEQTAMEASCTMVMVIGKGNWERMVLPSTPLLEETTYQQTQTKTILNPSFISFLVMKLIVTIEEFKTVMVQNLGVCCFVGDLKTTRLAASKYILSIILSRINRSTTTGGSSYSSITLCCCCRAEEVGAGTSVLIDLVGGRCATTCSLHCMIQSVSPFYFVQQSQFLSNQHQFTKKVLLLCEC